MTVLDCRPLLNVVDVDRSLLFWRDIIGFRVVESFEEAGVLRWTRLTAGTADMMINSPDALRAGVRRPPIEDTSVVLYLKVESVRELRSALTAHGYAAPEIEAQAYGVDQLTLRDPDGYEVAFTSPTDLSRRT